MPRRTFYQYGLEARRIRLLLTPDAWAVLEADARKLNISVPALLELVVTERAKAAHRKELAAFGDLFPREHGEEVRP
jgi:hypothetical protein